MEEAFGDDHLRHRVAKLLRRSRSATARTTSAPGDDRGWGFVNGKPSALPWVLGGEWDFLDT
jgi:hypothetical protein